jgi:hypothetical protein
MAGRKRAFLGQIYLSTINAASVTRKTTTATTAAEIRRESKPVKITATTTRTSAKARLVAYFEKEKLTFIEPATIAASLLRDLERLAGGAS